jgi:uncharacterized integral membrane protein (TIGR00698 family)
MTPQDIKMNYVADLYGEVLLSEQDGADPQRKNALREYMPGLIVVGIGAAAATWFSEHYGMPVILAGLLLGLAMNFVSANPKVYAGLDLAATSGLRWGILLLGTQVTVMQIGALGPLPFAGLLMVMTLTICAGLIGARLAGLGRYAGVLGGGATAICGASAALAIYALIGKKRLDHEYFTLTLVGVALASAIAMSTYPLIASALHFTDRQAGFLMGAAVHDVAQALGGGYSFSQEAGEVATIVKLSRVALLAPVVALIGVAIGSADGKPKSLAAKLKLPWFILGFFGLVAVNSLITVPPIVQQYGLIASKALLLFAVTATAMRSRLEALLDHGWQAMLPVIFATFTAFAGATFVAWAFL